MRTRKGKPAEHLVRVKYFAHDHLNKACAVFASRAAALGPAVDLGALVKEAIAVERTAMEKALRPERKRKPDGPRIYLRLNPEDRSLIADAAKRRGVTPTEFVREAARDAAYAKAGAA